MEFNFLQVEIISSCIHISRKKLGRTYVHSEIRDIFLKTYRALKRNYPKKVFKYAETGFKNGGKFKPHKTHQNGLSLDHMVPVLKNGKSVHLPTNIFNKWGYGIDFDLNGNYKKYKLDFEALGFFIVELHKQTLKKGYKMLSLQSIKCQTIHGTGRKI